MRAKAFVVLALLITSGCADKAKPKFDECVAMEEDGRLEDAVQACKSAVSAAATSRAGKSAAEKLASLEPTLKEAKKVVSVAQMTTVTSPDGLAGDESVRQCELIAAKYPKSVVGKEAAKLLDAWKASRLRALDAQRHAAPAEPERVEQSACERRCAHENKLCDDCLFVLKKAGMTSDECSDDCYAGKRCTCP